MKSYPPTLRAHNFDNKGGDTMKLKKRSKNSFYGKRGALLVSTPIEIKATKGAEESKKPAPKKRSSRKKVKEEENG